MPVPFLFYSFALRHWRTGTSVRRCWRAAMGTLTRVLGIPRHAWRGRPLRVSPLTSGRDSALCEARTANAHASFFLRKKLTRIHILTFPAKMPEGHSIQRTLKREIAERTPPRISAKCFPVSVITLLCNAIAPLRIPFGPIMGKALKHQVKRIIHQMLYCFQPKAI